MNQAVYYLLSQLDSSDCVVGSLVRESLRKDLHSRKNLLAISSTPEDTNNNDSFFFGEDPIIGIQQIFSQLAPSITSFTLIDSRSDHKTALANFSNIDVICLLGGNPLTQIEFLKSEGYDSALQLFSGIIIGISAGAINMCRQAYCSRDDRIPETVAYDALGLVDLTIDPHFSLDNEDQISEAVRYSASYPILGLPDGSAIRVCPEHGVQKLGLCYQVINGSISIA